MKAKIIFEFSDPKIVANSIKPDSVKKSKRVREEVKTEGKNLIISLEASDLGALKAATNSYLSFIQMALKLSGGEK